jgi:SAM-dependent methyltransferase
MLPPLTGGRVLDLGCGFGQFTRWAATAGAASVVGIDLSEKMLARARAETTEPNVSYRRADLDTLQLEADAFDLVFSSLAFHYVEDFGRLIETLAAALAAGGRLVFSVEHPIYAARAEPEWVTAADGRRAFAIADYLVEGRRVTDWVTSGVVKHHRTISTMLRTLARSKLALDDIFEWTPSEEQLAARPDLGEELVRPMFLLISARKSSPS